MGYVELYLRFVLKICLVIVIQFCQVIISSHSFYWAHLLGLKRNEKVFKANYNKAYNKGERYIYKKHAGLVVSWNAKYLHSPISSREIEWKYFVSSVGKGWTKQVIVYLVLASLTGIVAEIGEQSLIKFLNAIFK